MSEVSSAPPRGSLRARLFVMLQYLLPQHFLSRIVLRATRIRTSVVKNALISQFVRGFQPDMSEAAQPDPLRFASFNDFFARALRPDGRPVDWNPLAMVSPVDGTVSQIGALRDLRLLQAKGRDYTLDSLLAYPGKANTPQAHWTERFRRGGFATLYLAPYDYHRIHMPLDGTLRSAWYVPGRLFSVNAVTAAAVPNLFARNERVVCIFEDGPRLFAMVLVGALFVGSISTVWHGDVTPRSRRPIELPLDESRAPLHLPKGAQMGGFNMGSTVILLTPEGMADWTPEWVPGARIKMGKALALMKTSSAAG